MRGVLGLAGIIMAAGLAAPGPVSAQLPPLFPPPGEKTSIGVGAPRGEAPAVAANASRTSWANENGLIGPLDQVWKRTGASMPLPPLIAEGVVAVPGYSPTRAYALGGGKQLWSRVTLPSGNTEASGALLGNKLILTNGAGSIGAVNLGTGAQFWQRELVGPGDSGPGFLRATAPPAADGGRVFTWSERLLPEDGSAVFALEAGNGSVAWSRNSDLLGHGVPAIDNQRMYIADGCGNAEAYYRANGYRAWSRIGATTNCGPGDAIVAGGRVFTAGGKVYDALNGEPRRSLPAMPDAIAGGLALLARGGALEAFSLGNGKRQWRSPVSGDALVVAGGAVHVGAGNRVRAFDLKSGDPLSYSARLSGEVQELSAGGGSLMVHTSNALIRLTSFFDPPANGLEIGGTATDIFAGKGVGLIGVAGAALGERVDSLTLKADPFPGKGKRVVSSKALLGDNSSHWRVKVSKNTAFRVSAGKQASGSFRVYAYPRLAFSRVKAISRRKALANAQVSRVPSGVLRRHRMILYAADVSRDRYRRVGSERLKPDGRKKARASITFKIPRWLARNDTFIVCVQGLARSGYGRPVGIGRTCGKGSLPIRDRASARSAPRSSGWLPAGTREATPVAGSAAVSSAAALGSQLPRHAARPLGPRG